MRTWNRTWRWLRLGGVCGGALLVSPGCATGPEEFGPQVKSNAPTLGSNISIFRDVMAPHGEWLQLPEVGWVWRPDAKLVGQDFVPYATNGQWVFSDWGWTFQSDWDWGWAPFHFGRWFVAPSEGWVWWPDDEWAPSWVDWRWGEGLAGWQPMPLPGMNVRRPWTFVATRDLVQPDVSRFLVPPDQEAALVGRTQPVGERVTGRTGQWNVGPVPDEVASATGAPVPRTGPIAPPTGQPPIAGPHAAAR